MAGPTRLSVGLSPGRGEEGRERRIGGADPGTDACLARHSPRTAHCPQLTSKCSRAQPQFPQGPRRRSPPPSKLKRADLQRGGASPTPIPVQRAGLCPSEPHGGLLLHWNQCNQDQGLQGCGTPHSRRRLSRPALTSSSMASAWASDQPTGHSGDHSRRRTAWASRIHARRGGGSQRSAPPPARGPRNFKGAWPGAGRRFRGRETTPLWGRGLPLEATYESVGACRGWWVGVASGLDGGAGPAEGVVYLGAWPGLARVAAAGGRKRAGGPGWREVSRTRGGRVERGSGRGSGQIRGAGMGEARPASGPSSWLIGMP